MTTVIISKKSTITQKTHQDHHAVSCPALTSLREPQEGADTHLLLDNSTMPRRQLRVRLRPTPIRISIMEKQKKMMFRTSMCSWDLEMAPTVKREIPEPELVSCAALSELPTTAA